MPRNWNIRHSPIGWVARKAIHLLFRARHSANQPLTYRLPRSIDIRLYPEGEVVEFLSFPALFERAETELIASYLKPGMRVIDVGANVGLYSILASSIIGGSGAVWAFEPSGESYRRLLRNLELNGCSQVHPFQIALSSEADKVLRLKSDSGYGDAYRYLAPAGQSEGSVAGEEVRATTLDECAKEHGIRDVDLIKIDVEGGEHGVLRGASEVLSNNREVTIVFESEADWCERAGCKQSDAFTLLRNAGFHLYAWNKTKRDWQDEEDKLLRAGMVWAVRHRNKLPSP
jgi:FkbM family methyltransferase